jgi:hypothetical protein
VKKNEAGTQNTLVNGNAKGWDVERRTQGEKEGGKAKAVSEGEACALTQLKTLQSRHRLHFQ